MTLPLPAAVQARHQIEIVSSPKFDAWEMVAAQCVCGRYRGCPSSLSGARESGAQHVGRAAVNDAAGVLDAGLTWLLRTVQPDPASVAQHHGAYRIVGDRIFGFVPNTRWPIVTMELAAPHRDGRGTLTNPLTRYDVSAFVDAMRLRGQTVVDQWNGKGTHGLSLALAADVSPTLAAAVSRYHRGCPDHGSVFCGRDGCDWWTTHRALLADPAWPTPVPEVTA